MGVQFAFVSIARSGHHTSAPLVPGGQMTTPPSRPSPGRTGLTEQYPATADPGRRLCPSCVSTLRASLPAAAR